MMYKKIDVLQIEHSSICNAACPQCLREWWGGDHSRIKQTYIPTEFYEKQIPQYVYDNLTEIDFCGTVGDPCTAPNFIEVCKVIKQKNPKIKISVATNGGMRDPEWWTELGSTLTNIDNIIFGIDGLEDTNWIYRVNVRWSKLMANVKAFIAGGGIAYWQMIMFKHNEHQYEQAELLSKELGFRNFFKIYNHRFMIESATGRLAKGGNGEILMPPSNKSEQSIIIQRKENIIKEREAWVKEANKSKICCEAVETNSAYIDAETHLMPCCFIAGAKFTLHPTENPFDGYYDLWSKYGGDNIKLDLHDWNTILEGNFFKSITERWEMKLKEGRLIVCSMVCSKNEKIALSVFNNNSNI